MSQQGVPSFKQRPDLYDDFDGLQDDKGAENAVRVPASLQKILDQRAMERKPKAEAGEASSGK